MVKLGGERGGRVGAHERAGGSPSVESLSMPSPQTQGEINFEKIGIGG